MADWGLVAAASVAQAQGEDVKTSRRQRRKVIVAAF